MEKLVEIWPIALAAVGFIVWLVRLEGKSIYTKEISDQKFHEFDKRINALQIKHDALDSKIVDQLSEVRESLARLEGALGLGVGKKD